MQISKKYKRVKGKRRILVVDDDESLCRTLKLVFDKKGYETDIAFRGKEALRKTQNNIFDLAILDIKLPDIDGTDIIPFLKGITPGLKIIMMTGYSTRDNVIKSLNNGASHYLTKPFDMNEALEEIDILLTKESFSESKKLQKIPRKEKLNKIEVKYEHSKLPFKIRKAVEYIEKNYKNPDLCLREISAFVNMHPTYFSALWNKTIKTNLSDFINEFRMEEAQTLLSDTSIYIAQIAKEVGYKPDYFCKLFKKIKGVSPFEYRSKKFKAP